MIGKNIRIKLLKYLLKKSSTLTIKTSEKLRNIQNIFDEEIEFTL